MCLVLPYPYPELLLLCGEVSFQVTHDPYSGGGYSVDSLKFSVLSKQYNIVLLGHGRRPGVITKWKCRAKVESHKI